VIIVGDAEVGKSVFLKVLKTGEFLATYNGRNYLLIHPCQATNGTETMGLNYFTTRGSYSLEMWDIAGSD
jgi:GTPase SAR1 family protein